MAACPDRTDDEIERLIIGRRISSIIRPVFPPPITGLWAQDYASVEVSPLLPIQLLDIMRLIERQTSNRHYCPNCGESLMRPVAAIHDSATVEVLDKCPLCNWERRK